VSDGQVRRRPIGFRAVDKNGLTIGGCSERTKEKVCSCIGIRKQWTDFKTNATGADHAVTTNSSVLDQRYPLALFGPQRRIL
jgi:hypothetical protein